MVADREEEEAPLAPKAWTLDVPTALAAGAAAFASAGVAVGRAVLRQGAAQAGGEGLEERAFNRAQAAATRPVLRALAVSTLLCTAAASAMAYSFVAQAGLQVKPEATLSPGEARRVLQEGGRNVLRNLGGRGGDQS